MRTIDLITGETYGHLGQPTYHHCKVIKIIPPHTAENVTGGILVKVRYTVGDNDGFGVIKYLKASDLVKGEL